MTLIPISDWCLVNYGGITPLCHRCMDPVLVLSVAALGGRRLRAPCLGGDFGRESDGQLHPVARQLRLGTD